MAHDKTFHVIGDDVLEDLDAVGLARAIRNGTVDRGEVIDAAINRCLRINHSINAIEHFAGDAAREHAMRWATRSSPGFPRS